MSLSKPLGAFLATARSFLSLQAAKVATGVQMYFRSFLEFLRETAKSSYRGYLAVIAVIVPVALLYALVSATWDGLVRAWRELAAIPEIFEDMDFSREAWERWKTEVR